MRFNKKFLTVLVLALAGCGTATQPQAGPVMSKDDMKAMATAHATPKKSAAETQKTQQARQHAAHGGR